MKKILLLILLILCCCQISAFSAANYSYSTPKTFKYNSLANSSSGEQILFIVDFSNSMNERLGHRTKMDIALSTMKETLQLIPPSTSVGLRVYGHKCGLTAFQACKASELVLPISTNSTERIPYTMNKLNPRGMTPITYSLKQAVLKDFGNFQGRKHIILFTDGGENCDESPCKYAIELSKLRRDIIIDVIAFNIGNKDDLEQLECTALVTKGEFYKANSKPELYNVLDKILEKQKRVEAKILY